MSKLFLDHLIILAEEGRSRSKASKIKAKHFQFYIIIVENKTCLKRNKSLSKVNFVSNIQNLGVMAAFILKLMFIILFLYNLQLESNQIMHGQLSKNLLFFNRIFEILKKII